MPEYKEQGVILKIGHFHESDLWLKMLLPSLGAITVFAFGGAKSKKRFCGCLDILNLLDCRILANRSGQYLILQEASLVSMPCSLRTNWRNMGYMANCLKFLDATPINQENGQACFDLLLDLRDTLETRLPLMCQYFFRLRLARILGYMPELANCVSCQTPLENGAICSIPDGRILCPACFNELSFYEKRQSVRLSASSIQCLDHAQKSLPASWPVSGIPANVLRECGQFIDAFIEFHLGLIWQDNFFRKM